MASTVTAKQLRYQTGSILRRVAAGERLTVTLRGKEVAMIVPIYATSREDYDPVGFGMWRDREDVKDVQAWIDKIRRPRTVP